MYKINTDCSIEPFNPDGILAWAFIVKSTTYPRGEVFRDAGISGKGKGCTNNQGEYHAVMAALLWALDLPEQDRRPLLILSDSQLIVNQCEGQWNVNNPQLKELHTLVLQAVSKYGKSVKFKWIPRLKNKEADEHSRSVYTEEMLQEMRDQQLKITFGDDDLPF